MKTIGILGGMTWESTIDYYRIINEITKQKLGSFHSAKILLYSFDLQELIDLQDQGKWDEEAKLLADAAEKLENAGADFIVIACNTVHKKADFIQSQINIPLLHIADATADAVKNAGIRKVALLGTKYTMDSDFYSKRLDVMIPDEEDRKFVNNVIYDELCLGKINPGSRKKLIEIIGRLAGKGAEGIILGCTELQLLIKPGDAMLPLFDTTKIHAEAAAKYALEGG